MKYQLPKSVTSISIGGIEYDVKDGVVDIDDKHVEGIKTADFNGYPRIKDELKIPKKDS